MCRGCPAYRWRDSDLGFYRELREPVVLIQKGEIQVQKHKDESTQARHWDGATRSSVEAAVMAVERRGGIRLY